MAVKVGINGFGRIGRNVLRASLGDPGIEFVAVNDITDPKTLAHLLKYDSVLGNLDAEIGYGEDSIRVNGRSMRVFKVKDPAALDWTTLGAQIVMEPFDVPDVGRIAVLMDPQSAPIGLFKPKR